MRCALLCLVAACGASQIQDRKAADLSKLGPATLETDKPKEGDPRPVKVRIWVDAGIRALPNWKADLSEQLDYAGQLLTPLLGVRLEVTDWKDWTRTGDPVDALRQLAETDPGKEVTWVIGFVTPGDGASKAMSELGDAQLLGHHVVVRGWAEQPESDALASLLPDLKTAEHAEVLGAHKRHKQTVVLLHMLARTLGAVGESDVAWIQNPAYSAKQKSFSDRNRDLLQIAIDARISDDTDAELAHSLLEKLDKEDWGGWIAGDKEQIVTQLRAIVQGSKAGHVSDEVPVAALEQYQRIKGLAARGDLATALAELDNLLVAYPGTATIHLLKCELLVGDSIKKPPAKSVLSDKAKAACARVVELSAGDPRAHFILAEFHMRANNDVAAARAELVAAAKKIVTLDAGAPDAWKHLLAIYAGMGALTWQEDVIAQAKLDADPAASQVATARVRYGVPRGNTFVKAEDEGVLVGEIKRALNLGYAKKYGEAQKIVAAGEKRWPGAPGFAAVRCDMFLAQAQLEPARTACSKALAADPKLSWALYLSGVIALKNTGDSGTKAGIEKLKRAIEVDPELGQAWRTLAKAYTRAKDNAALEALATAYAAKFGTPLPP